MKLLPKADEHYDYWLGTDHLSGPAILHSRIDGLWFVLIGVQEGFIWEAGRLKRFDSPKSAWKELDRILAKTGN